MNNVVCVILNPAPSYEMYQKRKLSPQANHFDSPCKSKLLCVCVSSCFNLSYFDYVQQLFCSVIVSQKAVFIQNSSFLFIALL